VGSWLSPEAEFHVPLGQLVQNVAGIGQRPGEPVQLGHHECVAGSAGTQREPKAGAVTVGAG
jgi:hypothetical protein